MYFLKRVLVLLQPDGCNEKKKATIISWCKTRKKKIRENASSKNNKMELNNNSETDSSKEFKSKFWYFYYF